MSGCGAERVGRISHGVFESPDQWERTQGNLDSLRDLVKTAEQSGTAVRVVAK